jgi:hypothetical protein
MRWPALGAEEGADCDKHRGGSEDRCKQTVWPEAIGHQKVRERDQDRRFGHREPDGDRVVDACHRPHAAVELEPRLTGTHRRQGHEEGEHQVPARSIDAAGAAAVAQELEDEQDEPEDERLAEQRRAAALDGADETRRK